MLEISGGAPSLQPPWDFGSGGTSNSNFLCLQAVNISDLELRVAHSDLKSIWNFLLRHNLQVPVTFLSKKFFVKKNFWSKISWSKKFLDKFFLVKTFCWSKKIGQQFFMVEIFFGQYYLFG